MATELYFSAPMLKEKMRGFCCVFLKKPLLENWQYWFYMVSAEWLTLTSKICKWELSRYHACIVFKNFYYYPTKIKISFKLNIIPCKTGRLTHLYSEPYLILWNELVTLLSVKVKAKASKKQMWHEPASVSYVQR